MMNFEMVDAGPPLAAHELIGLEEQVGGELEESYRQFLQLYNGGRPVPRFFPIRDVDQNPFGSVHYFFGLRDDVRANNLYWVAKTYRGRIPREMFPIAGTETGDLVCISLRGRNKGTIYLWDHENERQPPTYENMHLVAHSFAAFLDSLHFRETPRQPLNG